MDVFELLGKVAIDTKQAQDALNHISKEGQRTEGKLSKVFSAIGKGAMVKLTKSALDATSSLQQNMGGAETVFRSVGDSISEMATKVIVGYDQATGEAITTTKTLEEVATNAYQTMGLSTSDFLATANKMGSLFKGAGFESGEALDLTTQAMQRAADVASIMGIDTAHAMESIAGAAKGNFTMMDNLGVAMNDTTLNAYALEKGIKKTTQQMTNQEKIGLAMQMFLEKTADYAGNYTKENETLAGSFGTAKAAFRNFLDGSGDVDQLANALTGAINSTLTSLEDIAPRLTQGLVEIANQMLPMIPPLIQDTLPVIVEGAVSLVKGLVAVLPTLLSTIESVLPSLIQGIVDISIDLFPAIIQTITVALQSLLPLLIDGLIQLIVFLCQNLMPILQPLLMSLPDIIIQIVDVLMQNLPLLIEGLITLVMGIVLALPDIMLALLDALPTIIEMVVEGLINALPILLAGLFQMAKEIIPKMLSYYAELPEKFFNIFKGAFNGIKKAFSGVKEFFGNVVKGIKNNFSSITDWFKDVFSRAWTAVKNVFSTGGKIFDGIKNGIANVFTTVVNKIIGGINKVIAVPFKAINNVLQKIRDVEIMGKQPFDWVHTFEVPEIPLLQWNARAVKNPRIFDKPTVYGYNPSAGAYQGVGEAGQEVVSGTATLMDMISSAVAIQNNALVSILAKILDAILAMDENMGGNLREALEGLSLDVNKREFARLVRGV